MVKVFDIEFQVNQKLLVEVTRLLMIGKMLRRDNQSLNIELEIFCKGGIELELEK